jgi:hypothetical protein
MDLKELENLNRTITRKEIETVIKIGRRHGSKKSGYSPCCLFVYVSSMIWTQKQA